jgi:hypothetical protein
MSVKDATCRFKSKAQRLSLFLVIILISQLSVTTVAESQTARATLPVGPLVVGSNSHLVVMEYENWFGPKAVTFQGTAAMPLLQSKDMQAVGGGYDSADPAVIKKHLEWF